jgi:hypothetical protein
MHFYIGLHQPSDAWHFERSFVSVNRLKRRKSDFRVNRWILDSGAFTELERHGAYRDSPEHYAAQIDRWSQCGSFEGAFTQDYMCEPFMLKRTGLTVREHQTLTIDRFRRIQQSTSASVFPVLQGYQPREYAEHLCMYGDQDLLKPGTRMGVGTLCKRNSSIQQIEDILERIHEMAPALLLHGFGLKLTALRSHNVRSKLFSADSMAWSFAARMHGMDQNCWRTAKEFERRILGQKLRYSPYQFDLFNR